jgi:hypothetical protein
MNRFITAFWFTDEEKQKKADELDKRGFPTKRIDEETADQFVSDLQQMNPEDFKKKHGGLFW